MTTYDSSPISLIDDDFGDSAEVIEPTLEEHPYLQYMTGILSTLDRRSPVGWHVRARVNPQVDRWLAARGAEQYVIQHETGDEPLVLYWNLHINNQPCSLIIVANGVQSPREMNKDLENRSGIAYGVGIAKDRNGNILYKENSDQPKMRPQLQFRAYVHELLGTREHPDQGFNDWFQISLSNYILDDMFTVLNAQYAVLDAYDADPKIRQQNEELKAQGKPENHARYWGFSIPTVPSVNGRKVGPDKDRQKTIYPMVHQIPPLRAGTSETIAYLNRHRIPRHIQETLVGEMLDETLVWSMQRSLEIVHGKQQTALSTMVTEVIDAPARELPPPPAEDLVNQDQILWIRETYCGNNADTIQKICNHFRVADLAQLRVSQYTLLYDQLTKK